MRLLAAHMLRAITSVGIGLALLISLVTAVGIVVVLAGDGEAAGFRLGEILPMWAGCVALLLAISRLAYLGLARIVDVGRSRDGE